MGKHSRLMRGNRKHRLQADKADPLFLRGNAGERHVVAFAIVGPPPVGCIIRQLASRRGQVVTGTAVANGPVVALARGVLRRPVRLNMIEANAPTSPASPRARFSRERFVSWAGAQVRFALVLIR